MSHGTAYSWRRRRQRSNNSSLERSVPGRGTTKALTLCPLSPALNPDHGHFHDLAILVQHLFHIPWINAVFAGHNRIPLATDDEEVTISIHHSHIAGVEPAIPQHRLGGLFVLPPPISVHNLWAAYHQFANLPSGQVLTSHQIHDPGIGVGDWNPDGADLAHTVEGIGMSHRGSLRQAVAFDQPAMREFLEGLLNLNR